MWNSSNNTFTHSFIRDTIEKEFFYYAMVKQREYERYEWFGQINAEWVLIDRGDTILRVNETQWTVD